MGLDTPDQVEEYRRTEPTAGIERFRNQLFEFLSAEKTLIVLTVVPVAVLFAFVNLLPILWAVAAGFHEISAFSPEWEWVGLENYTELLTDDNFYSALYKSLLFTVGTTGLNLLLGIGFALLVNRTFRGISLVRAILMLPYMVSTAVLGFITLWMANSQFGIINQVLADLGLINEFVPWFGAPELAMLSVILTNSWKFSIFVTIMVLARLQGIPDGIYEAAKVSGATPYQRFRDITLPNLKGVIFIVILLRGVWNFNKFDILFILTQGGPAGATTTAPIHAYNIAFLQTSLGEAAAMSTILFVILVSAATLYFYVLEPEEEVRVE